VEFKMTSNEMREAVDHPANRLYRVWLKKNGKEDSSRKGREFLSEYPEIKREVIE